VTRRPLFESITAAITTGQVTTGPTPATSHPIYAAFYRTMEGEEDPFTLNLGLRYRSSARFGETADLRRICSSVGFQNGMVNAAFSLFRSTKTMTVTKFSRVFVRMGDGEIGKQTWGFAAAAAGRRQH